MRSSNPFKSRQRDRIRDAAKSIINDELDSPEFHRLRDNTSRKAYLRSRVRDRIKADDRFGGPLVTWLMTWALTKLIELAISIWLKNRGREG